MNFLKNMNNIHAYFQSDCEKCSGIICTKDVTAALSPPIISLIWQVKLTAPIQHILTISRP